MNDELNRIEFLLERYYAGETDRDETAELSAFFRKCVPSQLPPGLRADAEMFILLEDERSSLEASVPESVESDIRSIIGNLEAGPRRHPRLLRYLPRVAACAAAAGLLVWFSVMHVSIGGADDGASDIPATAMALAADPQASAGADCGECIGESTAGSVGSAGVASSAAAALSGDNYVEISSPDEATMLAQDAFALIRDKLALAKNSIADVSDGISQMGETIQTVIID